MKSTTIPAATVTMINSLSIDVIFIVHQPVYRMPVVSLADVKQIAYKRNGVLDHRYDHERDECDNKKNIPEVFHISAFNGCRFAFLAAPSPLPTLPISSYGSQ
jgi:hypothetical protein